MMTFNARVPEYKWLKAREELSKHYKILAEIYDEGCIDIEFENDYLTPTKVAIHSELDKIRKILNSIV